MDYAAGRTKKSQPTATIIAIKKKGRISNGKKSFTWLVKLAYRPRTTTLIEHESSHSFEATICIRTACGAAAADRSERRLSDLEEGEEGGRRSEVRPLGGDPPPVAPTASLLPCVSQGIVVVEGTPLSRGASVANCCQQMRLFPRVDPPTDRPWSDPPPSSIVRRTAAAAAAATPLSDSPEMEEEEEEDEVAATTRDGGGRKGDRTSERANAVGGSERRRRMNVKAGKLGGRRRRRETQEENEIDLTERDAPSHARSSSPSSSLDGGMMIRKIGQSV